MPPQQQAAQLEALAGRAVQLVGLSATVPPPQRAGLMDQLGLAVAWADWSRSTRCKHAKGR